MADVERSVEDGIATLTINRPDQRNALNPSVLRALATELRDLRAKPEIRSLILTGSGDRAFCAGADLARFADDASVLDGHDERRLFVELFREMRGFGKPIVAAINGHALAGGLGLALSCDLLIASETATFGTPEIRVGVWPMMIMAIITRCIGQKRALELFLTGDRVDAATALQWGMVNRVVAPDQVMRVASEWAHMLAGWSPVVLRLGRDAFYATEDMEFDQALEHLHAELTLVSSTEDFREGVNAFLEKRPPHFTGR